jgi:hypothetical protein
MLRSMLVSPDPNSWLRRGHQSRQEYKGRSSTVKFVICARTLVKYIELEGTAECFLDCEKVAPGLNAVRDS